ncbi:MAG TPA: hypothetical protein VFL57_16375 [Bryobacteraceae bacterium]|nr:hypothetical protein [Bryobacteraceae bacterium]
MSPDARLRAALRFAAVAAALCLLVPDAAFARRRVRIPETPLPPGPRLQEIIEELQKPLPPLDQSDVHHVEMLAQPPVLETEKAATFAGRGLGLLIYGSLLLFGWCIAFRRLPAPAFGLPKALGFAGSITWPQFRPRTNARAGGAATAQAAMPAVLHGTAPEPLSNSQIIHFKALNGFETWRDLLLAARAGNRVAREVLDSSPAHAAVKFQLTAADFIREFACVRTIVLSPAWVNAILVLLRASERFDPNVIVATPFGGRQELPLDAPIKALNAVLGYESLPGHVRRQLELRRWILWQTRIDGAEQPQVLAAFARTPATESAATADVLAARAAAAMRSS